jgi:hypothetical protein
LLATTNANVDLRVAALPPGADPADLITEPDQLALLRTALSSETGPIVKTIIDAHLDRITAHRPHLLDHAEGRIAAARNLAGLLTDLPTDHIVVLASYIATRTGVGIDTVAETVIANLEHDGPSRRRQPTMLPRTARDGSGFPPPRAAAPTHQPPERAPAPDHRRPGRAR